MDAEKLTVASWPKWYSPAHHGDWPAPTQERRFLECLHRGRHPRRPLRDDRFRQPHARRLARLVDSSAHGAGRAVFALSAGCLPPRAQVRWVADRGGLLIMASQDSSVWDPNAGFA